VNHIEDLLRDEFRHRDGLIVPSPDTMLARVGRVRRRRRAVAAATLGAVVAIASVVVASIGSAGGLPRTIVGGAGPGKLYTAEVINTIFVDPQHGYVVQQLCTMDNEAPVPDGAPTPDVHRACSTQLLATADGGQTWHRRSVPGEPATKDTGVNLAAGHSLMFWVDDDGRLALGGWDRRYWTTDDGGSTWSESSTLRDVGPPGSFGTFGPDDGLTFLHSPPPQAVNDKNPLVAASDGSFWLRCPVGSCVHVTRDHGASWQKLSTVDPAAAVAWVATSDGHTVYAAERSGNNSRVVRSTDGGLTWSTVLDLPWLAWSDLALPNGDLILVRSSQEGGAYRLAAGASELTPIAGAPAHAVFYRTGGVIAAVSSDQRAEPGVAAVASISTDDGVTWIAVPAPE
jgi:hypothetical protein